MGHPALALPFDDVGPPGPSLRASSGSASTLEDERRHREQIIVTVQQTVADLDEARITDPEQFLRRPSARPDRDAVHLRVGLRRGEHSGLGRVQVRPGQPHGSDYEHAAAQGMALFRRLAEVMRAGAAPDEPAALDAMAEHYEAVCHYWQPTPEAYAAMGGLYVTDPQQRSMAEHADQDLPAWLAMATEAYARQRLGLRYTPSHS